MIKEKIFITGISSSIMQQLIAIINTAKYEIIGLSRKPLPQNSENIKIIQADIANINLYEDHLKNCSLIIHAAAVTHSFNEKSYFDINYNITKKLVEKAKELNVTSFVYLSSNTANSDNGAYANSKKLAEKHLQKTLGNWQIFRISEIFGGPKNEGIEKLIQTVLKNQYTFYPKDIPSKFSPIYLNDVAKILHENIFVNLEKNNIISINGNEHFTFKEILILIKKIKGRSLRIIGIPKSTMFFLMTLSSKIPFFIGIIPDQIKRLYGLKTYGNINDRYITLKLDEYIKQILNKN
jgi:nucleoside-diphosphate-sugar epimerase